MNNKYNKKIFILNHYAGNMFFDSGGRHYYFAKYLKRFNNNPVIFCANSVHNSNKKLYFDFNTLYTIKTQNDIDVQYVFVKTAPYKSNGFERIYNIIQFSINLFFTIIDYVKKNGKPDIIIASSVHPLTLVVGMVLAKKYHINCICEIRDLWPESIVSYYPSVSKNNIIIKLLYFFEKMIYIKAKIIIFTMEGAYNYIIDKGWNKYINKDKIYFINNGVDLEDFNYNKNKYYIDDVDLSNNKIFKVVYVGSIRKVNNLELLLDVAKRFKNSNIKFLIWGSGDEYDIIKQRKEDEKIDNFILKGRIEKKYIPYIVSKADVNIAHNNSSSIFKYGVSFNKIFDYLAAGKPIICDFVSNYNPVISSKSGIECIHTVDSIVDAINYFYLISKDKYDYYCNNSINASKKYDFYYLSNELNNILINYYKK